ncbi:MAG: aldehyde dehydrogenase family protein, partial [Desulfobacterales bacterium]|nr:aldehyde dehydrogenase family protein [Desulfobacterales bacterium]
YYTFEPKGVIGIISPWNYPFTLLAGPAASALMAGNTVVLKPSSQTTGSGLIFKEIMEQAGIPQGAIQTVTGNGRITGQALIENEGLDMIFFTGSTSVGQAISKKAGERMIPTIMELGGKDVAVVTKNANIDRAAHGVVWGGMTNSGQTCIGTELVLVEKSIYNDFQKKVVSIVKNIKSGSKAGQVGSMTMKSQFNIVKSQVEDAKAKGAKILTGGDALSSSHGMYFPPTIIANTTEDMKVRKEETFGPLLPLVPFDTIDEAIDIANSTEYGLSGSIFTKDMEEGREIAKRLKTGSVNINDVLVTYAIPDLPFGGVKRSGVGNYHGKSGIRAFTNIKSITEFGWDLNREVYWYPIPTEGDRVLASALAALFSRNFFTRLKALIKMGKPVRKILKAGL